MSQAQVTGCVVMKGRRGSEQNTVCGDLRHWRYEIRRTGAVTRSSSGPGLDLDQMPARVENVIYPVPESVCI